MINYNHKKLADVITRLDTLPPEQEKYAEWIKAEAHLAFLRDNAASDELVIYANAEYTFVDSIVVPNDVLARMTPADLQQWHFDSSHSIAGYVYGGGRTDVWIERGVQKDFDGLQTGTQLTFLRTFEGWEDVGRNYIEVNQEYTHIAGIHWRPEKRAYCRFDGRGDLEAVVSVTTREDKGSNMNLVTFQREELEKYLSIADAVLVRRFDFTLLKHGHFNGWPDNPPSSIAESANLFYHQLIMSEHAAYTSGVQIIHPRRPKGIIHSEIKGCGISENRRYIEYIAHDWRHECIAAISTAPGATTNYFEADENDLPFELSPAFFRPEVLSKYKTDRDKYTLGERTLNCRAAWHLRGIDVNEAGQVHAYICDLRRLPYEEQLHWVSYNEEPKAPISKRAEINDFEGAFIDFSEPLEKVLSLVRHWHYENVAWWKLRDEKLLDRVTTPLTTSRDEWAESFMDLAKLIIEGFETISIRKKLDEEKIAYSKEEKTIALLEKLLNKGVATGGELKRLSGLRTVQDLRSKVKGHVGGSKAQELAQAAQLEHESFTNHFKHVCTLVIDDLVAIQQHL